VDAKGVWGVTMSETNSVEDNGNACQDPWELLNIRIHGETTAREELR